MKHRVATVCTLCVHGCGVEVEVEDGKPVGVRGLREHGVSRGFLCPRGYAALDQSYSPKRLRKPLIKKGEGWREVSWSEALEFIASKLKEIRQRYGARALAVWGGSVAIENLNDFAAFAQRFCDVYGTPNWVEAGSWCFWSMILARLATYGKYEIPDPARSSCVMLWAHNPSASDPLTALKLREAISRGAKLVVVDCRRTTWADKADIFLQPKPGFDVYVALAMINVIIEEELYDHAFVERWTVGFDRLAEHVADYTPELASGKAGVEVEALREAARLYAEHKPSCIVQGITSIDHNANGFQASRAIAILQALIGCLDVEGGFTRPPTLKLRSLRLPHLVKEHPLGYDRFLLYRGLYGRPPGFAHAFTVLEAARTGKPYPVKAMMVTGANPVITMPDADRVVQALQNLDLLVVIDLFMTDTAALAHVVLPACSFLERYGLCTNYRVMHGEPYVAMKNKCVGEFGESWPDWRIWTELAWKMGFREWFPWKSIEEATDWMLEPSGLSVKTLTEDKPAGLFYAQRFRAREYEAYGGFPTPSRKVELYSEELAKENIHPLPTPIEMEELKVDDEYPLLLISGSRISFYTHSQLKDVERLRKHYLEPRAEVHPSTLREAGLRNEDWAVIETKNGNVRIKVVATDRLRLDVVNIPHAWPGINKLFGFKPNDPVTGYIVFKGLPCKVKPS
jgi:anaerobic selenocysteine-containing dehydrogenase